MTAIRAKTTRSGTALLLALLLAALSGCDKLGLDNSAAEAAREEAEGKAIGSACRQSARPLEECYQTNRRASKAAIFAGWREMDAYMRENKIEGVTPKVARDQGQPAEEIIEDSKQPQAAGGVPRTSGRAAPPGVEVAAQRQAPAKGH